MSTSGGRKDRPEIPRIGEGKRGKSGYLLYLLRQAATSVARRTERLLMDLDLTLPGYSALTMIAAYDGLSNADLSRLSMLSAQAANETVTRLEAAGLVSRAASVSNRRVRRLHVTAAGRARLARARRLTDRLERQLLREARRAGEGAVRRWLVGVAVALTEA